MQTRRKERATYRTLPPKRFNKEPLETVRVFSFIPVNSARTATVRFNLLHSGQQFFPNGGVRAVHCDNLYYKCMVHGCSARLIVSASVLAHMEWCPAKMRGKHHHPRNREVFLVRNASKYASSSKQPARDKPQTPGLPAAHHSADNSNALATLEPSVDSNNNNIDLPVCDGPRLPRERMTNVRILKAFERDLFEDYSVDPINLMESLRIYHALRIIEDSPFGKGVVCDITIEPGDYVGNFNGQLTRSLPTGSFCSFDISQGRRLKLFVNAEGLNRTLLG